MPRVIEPFKQFFDGDGDPLRYGWLYFLVSGTNNTEKDTYAEVGEENLNTNPLQLDGEGRCPSVFGSGTYRVISYVNDEADDSPGQMIQMFDPVGGTASEGYFSDWNAIESYAKGFILVGDDGEIYRSLQDENQGYAPSLNDERWEKLDFIRYYNPYVVYAAGDVARDAATGFDYISRVDANLGNTPEDSPDEWLSARKINWEDQTASFVAEANSYYRIDSTAAEVEVTLPVGVVEGDFITCWDYKGGAETYPIEVLNGAYTIMGASESFYIDKNYVTVTLTYDGTDWRFN